MSEARDPRVIEESRRQIERLSRLGWYHSIELPDGAVIEGHQSLDQLRRRLRQFPIPEDLRGKRVLDIGAWDGWFSFEMERRGAEVMALDSARNTRLLEARSLLGSRIEYQIGDICRTTAKDLGTFDIVLFLGVLYHVKHPVMALENVCGMCRDMACIESFVTDGAATERTAVPSMEFYETTELRGQLDNWVGPNVACLMAFCRTAGFARVDFAGALGERGHVTAWRQWLPATGLAAPPRILCLDNAATHDHSFSTRADDYATFYFTSAENDLTCDNVMPSIGPYGSRPIHVARTGGGWQATCKIPPGLESGWHDAVIRTARSGLSAAVRIPIDLDLAARRARTAPAGNLRLTRVADGKSFEDLRIRVGEDGAISVWAAGLPANTDLSSLRVRLDGADLPAIWLAPEGDSRQINALLPAGLEPGSVVITVAIHALESDPVTVELYRT
jgi:tRNA (mo5U34)-methyltransferase